MSIDARLQVRVAEILRNQLQAGQPGQGRGCGHGLRYRRPARRRQLPASAAGRERQRTSDANPYLDRARYGLYPPGSTFKVVTAMAALRKDPQLAHKTYECVRLPDGRVGNFIKGSNRPIRDDVRTTRRTARSIWSTASSVSCNAYFAQLGTYDVGAEPLFETANLLGIATASPDTAAQLKKSLPQSAYGQGQVVASPFQMARVAATVANGGAMPQGRWITDETNPRTSAAGVVLAPDAARRWRVHARRGDLRAPGAAGAASVPVAGKTGTAELADAPSHAWFIGFAPYGAGARKIAFSVLVENGVYGGTAAAPAAAEIVNAASKLGLIQP